MSAYSFLWDDGGIGKRQRRKTGYTFGGKLLYALSKVQDQLDIGIAEFFQCVDRFVEQQRGRRIGIEKLSGRDTEIVAYIEQLLDGRLRFTRSDPLNIAFAQA